MCFQRDEKHLKKIKLFKDYVNIGKQKMSHPYINFNDKFLKGT